MQAFIKNIKNAIAKHRIRTGIILAIIITVIFLGVRFINSKNSQQQYQTDQATKGTLVVSLSESGQIVSTGSLPLTTEASGVVSAVLVKNGQTVTAGQEIMEITPDQATVQAITQAQVDYNTATTNKMAVQSQLEQDRQNVLNAQDAVDTMTGIIGGSKNNPQTNSPYNQNEINSTNSTLTSARETFAADEKKYLQADTAIAVASQTLQQLSTKVTAPNSGIISNITYAPGMAISGGTQTATTGTGGSSSTTNSRTQTTIAMVQTDANTTPAAIFDISEVDAPKIKEGQQATITLDAFSGKTFTGKVIGINHEGVVSSGVVTYPLTIQLDNNYDGIAPNMSATANIIVDTKSDVLLVPLAAVQTTNGQSYVRVVKNGQITQTPVTVGESSDTQTEITSGLTEGDTVVVGTISSQSSGGSTSASPFSRSLFGGGGGTRIYNAGGGGKGQ
ncbi:MAG TPA: biotin/lipoyl-binding protein [Candidatus Saccharimonadales bacterium]|nr:biotin/lipoyl-binding protein [Candidatus Saccharimonadales bacterium]